MQDINSNMYLEYSLYSKVSVQICTWSTCDLLLGFGSNMYLKSRGAFARYCFKYVLKSTADPLQYFGSNMCLRHRWSIARFGFKYLLGVHIIMIYCKGLVQICTWSPEELLQDFGSDMYLN